MPTESKEQHVNISAFHLRHISNSSQRVRPSLDNTRNTVIRSDKNQNNSTNNPDKTALFNIYAFTQEYTTSNLNACFKPLKIPKLPATPQAPCQDIQTQKAVNIETNITEDKSYIDIVRHVSFPGQIADTIKANKRIVVEDSTFHDQSKGQFALNKLPEIKDYQVTNVEINATNASVNMSSISDTTSRAPSLSTYDKNYTENNEYMVPNSIQKRKSSRLSEYAERDEILRIVAEIERQEALEEIQKQKSNKKSTNFQKRTPAPTQISRRKK